MMDRILVPLAELGDAGLKLLLEPYTYLAVILVGILWRRQIQLQRKLFFARFHSFLKQWIKLMVWGICIGLIVSIIMFAARAPIEPGLLPVVWLVAILLMLLRFRFVSVAYVLGFIGLVHAGLKFFDGQVEWPSSLDWLIKPILQTDVYSLLLLIGLLHLLESLFLRLQGSTFSTPMFYMSKRGKVIGGYQLQAFWPVPLLLLGPGLVGDEMVWHIWTDPEQWAMWLALLTPLPVVIGYSDLTLTQLPNDKVKVTSKRLLLFALLVIGLAVLAKLIPQTAAPACLLVILLHESIRLLARRREDKFLPLYTNSAFGLKVLAVIPRSPAAELGIKVGETIHKVNGETVHSRQQMYEAMLKSSAFCKLEVFDLDGQIRFLKRAMFQGEHHQLGLVLAPDEEIKTYAPVKEFGLFTYLRLKLRGFSTK